MNPWNCENVQFCAHFYMTVTLSIAHAYCLTVALFQILKHSYLDISEQFDFFQT